MTIAVTVALNPNTTNNNQPKGFILQTCKNQGFFGKGLKGETSLISQTQGKKMGLLRIDRLISCIILSFSVWNFWEPPWNVIIKYPSLITKHQFVNTSPKSGILDLSKLKALADHSYLTLSPTRNFRLFQTERVCRRQFQIWYKWQKLLQVGRKHCGKWINCSLRAISPFPTCFQKTCTADT